MSGKVKNLFSIAFVVAFVAGLNNPIYADSIDDWEIVIHYDDDNIWGYGDADEFDASSWVVPLDDGFAVGTGIYMATTKYSDQMGELGYCECYAEGEIELKWNGSGPPIPIDITISVYSTSSDSTQAASCAEGFGGSLAYGYSQVQDDEDVYAYVGCGADVDDYLSTGEASTYDDFSPSIFDFMDPHFESETTGGAGAVNWVEQDDTWEYNYYDVSTSGWSFGADSYSEGGVSVGGQGTEGSTICETASYTIVTVEITESE